MTIGINRRTLSAGTLVGDDIITRSGEKLGSVKEIMLDLDSGRIAYVVMSSGGFLGIGDKLFALPWEAVEVDGDAHAIVFDITRERLEQAPGFDKDNWPDFADSGWGASVHEFYGTRPYWETDLP
jgi:sporulation protein YlmC with PRC-barrel domain